MRAVLTRVKSAAVAIDGKTVGQIGQGFLILLGVGPEDTEETCRYLAEKALGLRVFEDENGKMNRSLDQVGGSVLVVSQFTLAADTERGMRPSFSKGASPDRAEALYDYFVERCRQQEMNTQTGRFAADMQVSLVNDGPVTFWLQV